MLRTIEDRDCDRTFSRIETWEEFLTRWKAIDTEQEAVGLLYAGGELLISSRYDERPPLIDRVRFYLRWSTHANGRIATVSQQLVIKAGLQAARSRMGDSGTIEVHQELLEFLGERWPTLVKPPYPRFIQQYLMVVQEHGRGWEHYCAALVRAMCVWGLAPNLRVDARDVTKLMELLEAYLKEQEIDAPETLVDIGTCFPPLTDFSGETLSGGIHTLEQILRTQAGHTLISWKAWQVLGWRGGQSRLLAELLERKAAE